MKKLVLFVFVFLLSVSNTFGANETIVIKELNLELVKCPAGSFMMGSSDNEFGRYDNETQHKVILTNPFYIGKYEVTQKQYTEIMGNNPSEEKSNDNPVNNVNYYEAIEFCKKLNIAYKDALPQGFIFDLPTEAQWEYACRAGTTSALNNGKEITTLDSYCKNLDEIAWYGKNSNYSIHQVGKKKPNAWGIYDMHGNVMEWCRDWVRSYSKRTIINPDGAYFGHYRVCRGGSFIDLPITCRSARQLFHTPSLQEEHAGSFNEIGFRVALVKKESIKTKGIENETSLIEETLTNGQSNEWNLKDINLEMVKCPSGSFMMGSSKEEYYERKNEIHKISSNIAYGETLHQVTISKPFYIGKYEITQYQYVKLMGINCSHFKGDNLPVNNVTWYEAKAFCEQLNSSYKNLIPEGYIFDLPTEAQWEYACRAGSNSSFYNGADFSNPKIDDIAWHGGNSGGSAMSSPHIIGQKKPNAWGIHDMHGNVMEFCRDWYGDYSNKKEIDPYNNYKGEYLVTTRGGSVYNPAKECRSAIRFANSPNDRTIHNGFRVALVPEESKEEGKTIKPSTTDFLNKYSNSWYSEELNLEMVKCPSGSFIMGSPQNEEYEAKEEWNKKINHYPLLLFNYNETPHNVIITKPFYIGKYEVTQKLYESIMGENPSKFVDLSKPVDNITFEKAKIFCIKLNEKYINDIPSDYEFALPSEAQWEYACRAGTNTALNNGKNLTDSSGYSSNLDEVAWYCNNSDYTTHKVGQKKPNAWGIYDMHGNVMEFCEDFYGDYSLLKGEDPLGFGNGNTRALKAHIVKGGSSEALPAFCRSAFRTIKVGIVDDEGTGFTGFRVALVPKRGLSFVIKDSFLDMVKCPAGTFMMGSPRNESGLLSEKAEKLHPVTITKPFYISKYEITQAQYTAVLGVYPELIKDDYPVVNINWYDAKTFCEALNELNKDILPQGYKFDLPTEAQWEYACRAGTNTAMNNGKNLIITNGNCHYLDEVGWYNKNSNGISHPVGLKQPNAWGIYDMHGNVWEWTRSYNNIYPNNKVIDPCENFNFTKGIMCRGGAYNSTAEACRSATRSGFDRYSEGASSLGFRVALIPTDYDNPTKTNIFEDLNDKQNYYTSASKSSFVDSKTYSNSNANTKSISNKKTNSDNNSSKPKQAVFITDENNVRSSPNVKSSLVAVPPKGTKCEILEQKDRWYKVKFGSTTGWTNRINLKIQ